MFVFEVTLSDLNLHLSTTSISHFNIWLHLPLLRERVRDDDVTASEQERSGCLLAPPMSILQLLGIEDVLALVVNEVHIRFEMYGFGSEHIQ